MWKDVAELLTKTEFTDDGGNLSYTTTSKTVFCKVQSIKASEFYQAASTNLKPELTIVIRNSEYSSEESLIFNDIAYRILRTFIKGENIELVCGGVRNG
jgi:SPP1 family predicted phage head-tail adaptor